MSKKDKWAWYHAEKVPASEQQIQKMAAATGKPIEEVRAAYKDLEENEEVILNDKYQVHIRRIPNSEPNEPGLIHLSIKRIDKWVIRDWRDLQRIKNELVGEEYEAVEIFPAESRLVDTSNQYHLWIIDDPTFRFPFGFSDRFVREEGGYLAGTRQRAKK